MSGPGPASKPDQQLQERLMLSFFHESHVSMWACDADFKIVLWNQGAAETYGRSADSALGRRYDELFIDEAEREQSLEDCRKIIGDGTRYKNFLALDHDARGAERQMLTNCFRITDPESGQHYQAEIGVNIADLEVAQKEHRTLRELGLQQVFERQQTLAIRKTALATIMADIHEKVRTRAAATTHDLDQAIQRVSPRLKGDTASRYAARREAVVKEQAAALHELRRFARRLDESETVDDTLRLERDLGEVGTWVARIDDAAASEE